MSEDDCWFSLLLVSRCTDMFYISFQFCFSDGFFHFPDPYIVIVTLQRCHFYFSEMNPPTTLYCFFSIMLWHYLVFLLLLLHRLSSLPVYTNHYSVYSTLLACLSSFSRGYPPLVICNTATTIPLYKCGLHEHTYKYP